MDFPDFRNARYVHSAHDLKQLPPDSGAEAAFAGRSNAGKSSAINTITDQKGLARTSKLPGRTQLINFFALDAERRLVDLPGYGFAKVPMAVKLQWQQTLAAYLETRRSLKGLCLVMDIRHPLTATDRQLCDWCAQGALPLHVLLTKADKLSRGAGHNVLHAVQKTLAEAGIIASVQLFSSLSGEGRDAARAKLTEWLGGEGSGQKKSPGNKGRESGA